MALEVLELAQNLGLAVAAEDFNPIDSSKLTRLLANATLEVEAYASTAPDTIKEEAIIRLCGYRFNLFVREGAGFANSFTNSGAASILKKYKIRRCGLINVRRS